MGAPQASRGPDRTVEGVTTVFDAAPEPPTVESITLLWLDDDAEYRALIDDALATLPAVDVVADADPTTALASIDDVDCVVSDLGPSSGDGLGVLADVRKRHERIPFVLHTEAALSAVDEGLFAADATDYVRKDWDEATVRLVARRARTLVERDRFRDVARRLAGAVDACRDPIVVVGPDDAIEYANGQFASAMGPARADLCGRDWTDLFTEDSVEQLHHDAIPVGTEGWTWSGTTALSAGEEEEVAARTTLVQIDDGSKVFAFRDLEQPA